MTTFKTRLEVLNEDNKKLVNQSLQKLEENAELRGKLQQLEIILKRQIKIDIL